MSLIINNILNPNDVGTVSLGNLGLFAGPGDTFYIKNSSGTYSPISTTSGFNTGLIFNTSSYVLSVTDGNSTQTASLIDLASGYYNTSLTISTSSNVLTLIDGFSTLTASLAYYTGGFNTNISYNTASNVLSITDGNSTISATLSLTGANTSFTFNPFNNILSIVDGFSTKTASLAQLSGNIGLSFSNDILTLQDGRGTLTASLSSNCVCLKSFDALIPSSDVLTLSTIPFIAIANTAGQFDREIISAYVEIGNGTTPYATNTLLTLRCGSVHYLELDIASLNTGSYEFNRVQTLTSPNISDSGNNRIQLQIETGNPTAGDYDIAIHFTYREVQRLI